jgi:hypothetical protein
MVLADNGRLLPASTKRVRTMSTEIVKFETAATAIANAAREESTGGIGKLLKFAKGVYIVGTEEVPAGTEFIARIESWVRGFVKFRSGSLIEHRIGKVADGFRMPDRNELGDLDESKWETGISGKKDPWCAQSYLPLENPVTGEIVTFVSGSAGGRGAIADLCGAAAKHMATMGLPRIKLAVESYKHKSFGKIEKPKFNIVGWEGNVPEPTMESEGYTEDDYASMPDESFDA